MMKNEETAKRLRDALSAADIIPAELSERSGVSQSSISQYLSGSHAPSNISSGKMASVLGCSPVWLMGFDVASELPATRDASPANQAAARDALSEHEREHIRKYRALDNDGRQMVDTVLDTAFWQATRANTAHDATRESA